MNSARTLWMGNIEPWMDETYLISVFKSFEFNPIKINIRKKEQAKGCCFVEMENQKIAQTALETLNGKMHTDFEFKLNWVNSKPKENSEIIGKKYTIYVGNLCKGIKSEELKQYFKSEFPSVIGSKIIYDPFTQLSKGFGFVDFQNYDEYQYVLNSRAIRTIRNNKISINSAKSKREEERNQEYYDNNTITTTTPTYNRHSNNAISYTNYSVLSDSNYKEYIPKGFDPNSSYYEQQSTCTSSTNNLQQDAYMSHNDDFIQTIQKGFKDIINMYKLAIVKPKISCQCNYYCNLNTLNKTYFNEETDEEHEILQTIDSISKNLQRETNSLDKSIIQ